LKAHAKNRAANHKVPEDVAAVGLGVPKVLFVHLDYSAGVVQHVDNCPLGPGVGAILRVRDRVTDRVRTCIPDRAVSKQFTNQINAFSVLARTNLVKVVAGRQPKAALFGTHGFHTRYVSCYLSNEFAAIKETFLLLFLEGVPVALHAFREHRLVPRPFLGRNIGGFAGEMQMFENLAAEA
jgi:hypothetical protein